MGQDKGEQSSDAGWENTQSKKSFNKNERWTGKSDSEVKANIEDRNKKRAEEEKFINMGKVDKVETPFMAINVIGNMGLDFFNKGSVKTRSFFKDSVLSKKGVNYKGIQMTKTQFENLSLEKQNEVYGSYMEGRMSGATDAYGNVKSGWDRDSKGNLVNRGGNDNSVRLTEKQIEDQSAAASAVAKKDQATEQQADYSKKKRLSVTSSRSLFANEGGRGFFN